MSREGDIFTSILNLIEGQQRSIRRLWTIINVLVVAVVVLFIESLTH